VGQHYRTTLMDRRRFDAWKNDGAKRLATRASEKAKKLLGKHQPHPLPSDIAAKILTMVEN